MFVCSQYPRETTSGYANEAEKQIEPYNSEVFQGQIKFRIPIWVCEHYGRPVLQIPTKLLRPVFEMQVTEESGISLAVDIPAIVANDS